MGLWLYDPSEIQQTFRQQCCRVVCQISQQHGDPNSQSRGLNTSSPRTHRPFWIRNLTIAEPCMYLYIEKNRSVTWWLYIFILYHTPTLQWRGLLKSFCIEDMTDLLCEVTVARPFPLRTPRRLFVRSRKVSKPRDWYFKLSYRFEIWQAHRQHCCRSACQVSERSDNSKYKSRGFETLRDLTERRLFGYWDGALLVCISVCAARHTLIFTHTNRRYHMRCGPDPMAWLGHMQSISHQA